MYSSLAMLYASYILEGKWEIENTPKAIRPEVKEIIDDVTKSQKTTNNFYR